jgi:ParB family chromosome partitioning protein
MRQSLGKGIDAIITGLKENETLNEAVQKINIDKIRPNRHQPRKNFDEESLKELAQSIQKHGLTQPIVVLKDPELDNWEIVAGERRWRAAKIAGLMEIDAIVKTGLSDENRLTLSLMENLQREDLNAIEQAMAYKKLMEDFGITQTELSNYCGKSKSAISNTLRLLELNEEIQKGIQKNVITEGHARVLISIPDREKRMKIYSQILSKKMSVRDVENYARSFYSEKSLKKSAKKKGHKSPEIVDMELSFQKHLGTKVEIHPGNAQNGKIIIHYYSVDDFDRISKIITK